MKNKIKEPEKFKHLTYEDFKRMAKDDTLSDAERAGFPDECRNGYETKIKNSIRNTLILFGYDWRKGNFNILDIGCGYSDLTYKLIQYILAPIQTRNNNLYLVDSKEILSKLYRLKSSYHKLLHLFPGKFPNEIISPEHNILLGIKFDIIIVYSVIKHVFYEDNVYGMVKFIDKALELLNDKGILLIGDIPNYDKASRFYKKYFTGMSTEVEITDSIILDLLKRYRIFGYETYILPQPDTLAYHNVRDDIVILKK